MAVNRPDWCPDVRYASLKLMPNSETNANANSEADANAEDLNANAEGLNMNVEDT